MTRAEQLTQAKEHLTAWMNAELKIAKGQEFRMGSRKLTMADLSYVGDRIRYWKNQVAMLEGGGGCRRTFHVIPMDR
jgi:hypothetical protein